MFDIQQNQHYLDDSYQGDIDRVKNFDANIFRREFTYTIFSGVRISLLGIKTTIEFDVFKGLRW